jgi:hypothetical protein
MAKRFTVALTPVAVMIAESMLSPLEAIGQSAPSTAAPAIAADPTLGALAPGQAPSILAAPAPPDFDSERDKGSDRICHRDRDRDCEVSPYRP